MGDLACRVCRLLKFSLAVSGSCRERVRFRFGGLEKSRLMPLLVVAKSASKQSDLGLQTAKLKLSCPVRLLCFHSGFCSSASSVLLRAQVGCIDKTQHLLGVLYHAGIRAAEYDVYHCDCHIVSACSPFY